MNQVFSSKYDYRNGWEFEHENLRVAVEWAIENLSGHEWVVYGKYGELKASAEFGPFKD